jgi:transcriptional regulator with XRE-family HTH domain
MDTTLDLRVKELLDARRGDWQAVADGSGISYSWLSKFSNGHIDNPGFATLKKLHAYLDPAAAERVIDQAA